MESIIKETQEAFIDFIPPFRPIQYLGSKLRLVEDIYDITERHKISNNICDIFSGSGVVSHFLAQNNNVISVDVQYYSSVLCSALTNGYKYSESEVKGIITGVLSNGTYLELLDIYSPLIELEEDILKTYLSNDDDRLRFAAIVENCSVYAYLNSATLGKIEIHNSFVFSALEQFEKNYNSASEKAKKASYCSYYFGGVYFSFKQSIFIDVLLQTINSLKKSDFHKYATLLASVLSTLSEIVSTVGKQFAQPMKLTDKNNKPKKLLSSRIVRDRSYQVEEIFRKWVLDYSINCHQNPLCLSKNSDYKEFLNNYNGKIGFFYADPPYTIDHYSRFYHILETIALYDYPQLEEMNKSKVGKVIMKGLYRKNRHQSPFSIPSKVEAAFYDLFKGASKFACPLLLSYSPYDEGSNGRARLIRIDRLKELAGMFYNSVEIIEVKAHSHRKLNKAENNNEANIKGETLLLCK